jgi:hypothetical protein
MAPLRKSEWIWHKSLLTSVILTAKADFRENAVIFEYKTLDLFMIITVIQDIN